MSTTETAKTGKKESLKNLVHNWINKKKPKQLLPPPHKIPGKPILHNDR